ncbi:hypothetical protein [Nonomuraea turkmeniaca]|uniref:hypothetical protein n=1 Tax=Nonomuraea turkmeniaca TaxID=103838 RepID=UPI001B860055|nr:hypothetical protein [Nonomuraea turkmeniaca]
MWTCSRPCGGLALGGKLTTAAAEQSRVDYLALAEALEAPLFTCDGKPAGNAHNADVQVFPRS